jgi:hypothetical protein
VAILFFVRATGEALADVSVVSSISDVIGPITGLGECRGETFRHRVSGWRYRGMYSACEGFARTGEIELGDSL